MLPMQLRANEQKDDKKSFFDDEGSVDGEQLKSLQAGNGMLS